MAKNQTVNDKVWLGLALTRIAIGFVFLWAFMDKLWGLGFATPAARAWVNGGSPTTGFLKMGVNPDGPLASFFNGLAGNVLVDWLFMLGLLGIGLALILGIGMRIAAWAGSLLLVLMYLAIFPLKEKGGNNPLVDDHIIYALVLLTLAWALPNQRLSLAGWWQSLGFVKKNTWLY